MGSALLNQWPTYLVYLLGIIQIVAGWGVMRRISAWSRGLDHYAMLLVMVAMLTYSLQPFTFAILVWPVLALVLSLVIGPWALVPIVVFTLISLMPIEALPAGLFLHRLAGQWLAHPTRQQGSHVTVAMTPVWSARPIAATRHRDPGVRLSPLSLRSAPRSDAGPCASPCAGAGLG